MAKKRGIGGRRALQLFGLVAFNGYYWAPQGKFACLPVLNCYACPIGTVACPIGSTIAFSFVRRFPFYILGMLGALGVMVGRAFCGWACPFGLLQDGLHKIPTRKWKLPTAFNGLKYLLLISLVFVIPFWLGGGKERKGSDSLLVGQEGTVDYCSTICPAGTLEGSIPWLITTPSLRAHISWRTWSKIGLLVVILGLTVVSSRFFCRALCPLGALMAFATPVSLLRLETNQEKCTRCRKCIRVCPTAARLLPEAKSGKEASWECVMCLDCVKKCPESGALLAKFGFKTIMTSSPERKSPDKPALGADNA
jgi:ferredoxin-type protein NapH